MSRDEKYLDGRINNLRSVSERLRLAKEALEINGSCPEADMTHEEDPYNIGFIWASVCNSLHAATDTLNSIMLYVEPGGLREAMEESEMAKHINDKSVAELGMLEEAERYKDTLESPKQLEDDGK
jgi:hypothetical protein